MQTPSFLGGGGEGRPGSRHPRREAPSADLRVTSGARPLCRLVENVGVSEYTCNRLKRVSRGTGARMYLSLKKKFGACRAQNEGQAGLSLRTWERSGWPSPW